jgi:hypothetical protein
VLRLWEDDPPFVSQFGAHGSFTVLVSSPASYDCVALHRDPGASLVFSIATTTLSSLKEMLVC